MPYRPVVRSRLIIICAERASLWRTNAIRKGDCSFVSRGFPLPHLDFRARTRIALRRDMSHAGWPGSKRSESRILASDQAWEFMPAGLRWFIVCETVFWYCNTFL